MAFHFGSSSELGRNIIPPLLVMSVSLLGLSWAADNDVCPSKLALLDDPFRVQERFDMFVKDVYDAIETGSCYLHEGKELSTQHVHQKRKDSYVYSIKICAPLKVPAVTQNITAKNEIVNLGTTEDSFINGGVNWFSVTYMHGKKYGTYCDKSERQTMLMVVCAVNVIENSDLRMIEEFRTRQVGQGDGCYYLFEYNHPAACSEALAPEARLMNPGTISLLAFAGVILAYLILGTLYGLFVLDASGAQLVPNLEFWKKVLTLSADGWSFIFRSPTQVCFLFFYPAFLSPIWKETGRSTKTHIAGSPLESVSRYDLDGALLRSA